MVITVCVILSLCAEITFRESFGIELSEILNIYRCHVHLLFKPISIDTEVLLQLHITHSGNIQLR